MKKHKKSILENETYKFTIILIRKKNLASEKILKNHLKTHIALRSIFKK